MPTVDLSDTELQSAAQAARVAREQALVDASRQSSPKIKEMFVAHAGAFDALAEKFEQARKSGESRQVSNKPTPAAARKLRE